jgi:integrase
MGIYRQPTSRYWWMRCARKGHPPIRESTGVEWDAASADQREVNRQLATDIYHARMGDLARGRYDLPTVTPPDPKPTLAEWIAWYRQHVTPTHRGQEREIVTLDRLTAEMGAHRLDGLTLTVITEWMTTRRAKVSAATVNREMDVLKSVLRSAVDHGHLDDSPVAGMRRLHTVTPKRRVMSRDEEAQILAQLRQPEDRALLIMAVDTLCRMGDCLDLRWQDDHDTTLWIGDPKTGEGYHVPVTTRLRAALDAVPEGPNDYVFWKHRSPETETERRARVAHMLRRACGRCDPPIPYGRAAGGLRWHWATRRTGATRMILAGAALSTVQKAGHWKSSRLVADIYLDTEDSIVRAAVEGIGADVPVLPTPRRQRPRSDIRPPEIARNSTPD